MTIDFFIPMIPPTVTHQEKKIAIRNGKPILYEPPRLKEARRKLEACLAKHCLQEPLTGAVKLSTMWCFPSDRSHKPGDYKTTKPDTDNLQKLLKDVMTDLGYWKDDALVCVEHIEKRYNDIPGIYISISELY